jgi:hypothetical protein
MAYLFRKNYLGDLIENPNWGTKVGCFPAALTGLTEGTTYQDTQEIYKAWTPDVRSMLTTDDKKLLESQANNVGRELKELKTRSDTALNGFKDLDDKINNSGGELTPDVNVSWGNANGALRSMSTQRTKAFTQLDRLMVYAPDASGAQQLCASKLDATNTEKQILDKIAEISINVNKKVTDHYKKQDDWLSLLLSLFQAFMDIIQALINLVLKLFGSGFALLGWAKDHPKIAIGATSVLALLILGLILRPYFSLLAGVFGKRNRKR